MAETELSLLAVAVAGPAVEGVGVGSLVGVEPGRYFWDGAGSVSPSLTTFEASV